MNCSENLPITLDALVQSDAIPEMDQLGARIVIDGKYIQYMIFIVL